jgi:small-conductance mechanosensitive channel
MSPAAGQEEQLEWERRGGRVAGAAAFAGIAVFVLAGVYLAFALSQRPRNPLERLQAAGREGTDYMVASVLQAIGFALFAVVLAYLYRATRHRRPQTPSAALSLAVLGPAVLAVTVVVGAVTRVGAGRELVTGPPTRERALPLLRDASPSWLEGLSLAGGIALGLALVLIGLNAMRAGLLSRFMGVLAVVAAMFLALPFLGGPPTLLFFWMGAVGLLCFGRWPGGRGPAWDTGEAVPWPTPAQQREEVERRRAEREGGGAPPTVAGRRSEQNGGAPDRGREGASGPESTPGTPRRKRKRRG